MVIADPLLALMLDDALFLRAMIDARQQPAAAPALPNDQRYETEADFADDAAAAARGE